MPKAGQGGVLLILKQDVNNGEKWLNLITAGSLVHSSPWELHASVSPLPPSKFRQKLREGEKKTKRVWMNYLCGSAPIIIPRYGLTVINRFNSRFGVTKERAV